MRGCNDPSDRYDGCRNWGAYELKCPKNGNGFPEFMLHSHFNEDGTPKTEEDEEVLDPTEDADVEDNITQESATESLLNAFEAYNLQ